MKVTVKDKNDNSPIFDRGKYDEPVAQDTPVGTQILRVSATDVDEGQNQKIVYDLTASRIPGIFLTFLSFELKLNAKFPQVTLNTLSGIGRPEL